MAIRMMNAQVVNLASGWICLVVGALNWWNMFGVGFTLWRIVPASAITLIGLWLLLSDLRTCMPTSSELCDRRNSSTRQNRV